MSESESTIIPAGDEAVESQSTDNTSEFEFLRDELLADAATIRDAIVAKSIKAETVGSLFIVLIQMCALLDSRIKLIEDSMNG